MKKKYFLWALIPVLLGVFLFLFYTFYNIQSEKKQQATKYILTVEELGKLKDGDFILRHGYGFVSDFIVESFNSDIDVSHCAILTKDDSNQWIVIHSVSQSLSDFDGVQSQPLDVFIRDSQLNTILVQRYKNNDTTLYKHIGERAKYYLSQRIPFDNSFNIADTTEFYCTELLWKVIMDVYHDDIFYDYKHQRQYHPKKFDALYDTSRFETVLDHHLRKNQKKTNT